MKLPISLPKNGEILARIWSPCSLPCARFGLNMTRKNLRIFIDTSVVFAAVLSPAGGSRKLFLLAEAGLLDLLVGPTVLKECEDVIRRKVPQSLSTLAQLLAVGHVITSSVPTKNQISTARSYVQYVPDARVLAEAIQAQV